MLFIYPINYLDISMHELYEYVCVKEILFSRHHVKRLSAKDQIGDFL